MKLSYHGNMMNERIEKQEGGGMEGTSTGDVGWSDK